MKVVLVEDEMPALEQMKMLLSACKTIDIEIVATLDSIEDCIAFFSSDKKDEVELVFMDIHLSDGSAFTIFKYVTIEIPIIFTTAYDEYALKAFEVNCLDYLLKPITKENLNKLFNKLQLIATYGKAINSPDCETETLLVTDSFRTVPIKTSDIAYFYTLDFKVKAYCNNGKAYRVQHNLEKLSETLSSKQFMRINRQFIISRFAIKEIENWEGNRLLVKLKTETPEKIIISRLKITAFKKWLTDVGDK